MKTINVDLLEEALLEMLPVFEKKQKEFQDKADFYSRQIDKIKSVISKKTTTESGLAIQQPQLIETRPASTDELNEVNVFFAEKTPHGRVKKGQSRTSIVNFLKTHSDDYSTIKEIADGAKTVYGTTRRVLYDLEAEAFVNQEEGLWKWRTE